MNRKIVNALLLLCVLFTLYNTLIPFDFQFKGNSIENILESIDWRFFIYKGRWAPITDIVGNILLFIPLGFLLYLWRFQRGLESSIIGTAFVGLLLSVFIEFLQLFVQERISSITDLFNNTLGTLLGALSAWIYFRLFATQAHQFVKRLYREQPITIVLLAVFVLQAAAAIIPFNVSITVSDLKNSIKQIIVTPFQTQSLSYVLLGSPVRIDGQAFSWYKFLENFLFWSCWGYITALCYNYYWRMKQGGVWLMIVAGFIPGIFLEALQIFIVSRYCDINDIISNWAGVITGLFIYRFYRPHYRFPSSESWRALSGAVVLYLVCILFAGLQPFDFKSTANGLLPVIGYQHLVPFLTYYKNTSIWNISDLITGLLYFYPVSLYMSYALYRQKFNWRTLYVCTGTTGFLMGALIEFCQLYSPTRVGDITDVLLYSIGGLLGTFSLIYYFQEIQPYWSQAMD